MTRQENQSQNKRENTKIPQDGKKEVVEKCSESKSGKFINLRTKAEVPNGPVTNCKK
jgi:hypothetical protein